MIRSLSDVTKAASPWLRRYRLGHRGYWLFFIAALLWDAGFGVYFFLFNLYLLDFHLNERTIGLVNGALSLGLITGMFPAVMLARRIGARRVLIWGFLAASVLGVLRAIFVWQQAAIVLAFFAGIVMCVWPVLFLPVTASLTSEDNRAAATGLIFSIGIGATACGVAATGYLSRWVGTFGMAPGPADVKRIVLLLSSGVVACGTIALMHLPVLNAAPPETVAFREQFAVLRQPFLRRFLPCVALWTSLLGAFTPFAAVYFAQQRHTSLSHVGFILSASQLAQLTGGLVVPLVERSFGLTRGIVMSQLATGVLLALTAISPQPALCIVFFCSFSAAQWICSPAMYTLLMNNVVEADRAGASAMVMFSNYLLTAAATPAMGILLLYFGYLKVMIAIATLECLLAASFHWLIPEPSPVPAPSAIRAESFTD
ncbi:MAG TPA: MFS transporter [Terracidiphilus sp.]|nr:MFS transporter [Terracidiphilus sp.]